MGEHGGWDEGEEVLGGEEGDESATDDDIVEDEESGGEEEQGLDMQKQKEENVDVEHSGQIRLRCASMGVLRMGGAGRVMRKRVCVGGRDGSYGEVSVIS